MKYLILVFLLSVVVFADGCDCFDCGRDYVLLKDGDNFTMIATVLGEGETLLSSVKKWYPQYADRTMKEYWYELKDSYDESVINSFYSYFYPSELLGTHKIIVIE